MINFLIGPPGAGKSYEAVAFHVLPALRAGRKVITNLPLNVDKFALLDPDFPALIEIRTETLAKSEPVNEGALEANFRRFGWVSRPRKFNRVPFANVEDYGDKWRHPETGAGPLYVIDECHIPLPRSGTPVDVEVWYSLHRHETADVLLMVQSYGKVNKAICDLCQVCYRVKKAVALGSSKAYIRKVQDGLRGAVVNESIRKYESKYFDLYQSHTKGGGAELGATDIKPFWKHWTVIGAGLFLFFGIGVVVKFASGLSPMDQVNKTVKPITPASSSSQSVPVRSSGVVEQSKAGSSSEIAPSVHRVEALGGPYQGITLHVLGRIQSGNRYLYLLMSSQNGQPLKTFDHRELEQAGYQVEPVSDYVMRLTFDGSSRYVLADAPTVTIDQSASPGQSHQRAEGARRGPRSAREGAGRVS